MNAADLGEIESLVRAGQRDAATSALRAWSELPAASLPDALARACGLALQLGDAGLAVLLGERFARVAPNFPGAHHALGLARAHRGDLPGAVASLRRAVDLAPHAPPLHLHLANALLELGELDAAVASYDECLRLRPDWRDARIGRGLAHLRAYRGREAREDFAWWTTVDPQVAAAWRGLAEALELEGDLEAALRCRDREIALDPDAVDRRRDRAFAIARMGLTDAAREALADVLRRAPHDLGARWVHWNLPPLLHADEASVTRWREHWLQGLREFEALPLDRHGIDERIAAMVLQPPFFMHYQGGDLLPPMRRFGALCTRWSAGRFDHARVRQRPREQGRLRIGFASAYLRDHTVWGLFGNWLKRLDRARFEVVAIHLGGTADHVTRGLDAIADRVIRGHTDNDAWARALIEADLDALIWLDIGMDGLTQVLAPTRFAPATAMAWGHPVTSGLPAVDYFLSGDAMEPADADAHYAERLVRLPGLGIRFDLPDSARGFQRRTLPLHGEIRLLCAQSVFKWLPANQELLARIARRVPRARFDVIPHPVPAVRALFVERLRAVFASHGQDFDTRVTVHGFLSREAFMRTMREADVMIDTQGWSGGHTTLEALAHDLPVVTRAGDFMRARHTHGMLRLLGLDAMLSAADDEAHVDLVARLCEDADFHARAVAAIAARKAVLYDDDAPIRGLEDFLWRACGRA